jgi:hypothetical protein
MGRLEDIVGELFVQRTAMFGPFTTGRMGHMLLTDRNSTRIECGPICECPPNAYSFGGKGR